MNNITRSFLSNPRALVGLAIVLFFMLIALCAPILSDHGPNDRVARPHQPPNTEQIMGSTRMGRDVFTQLVHGTQTSLLVGFLAGFIVTAVGTLVGITAGYFGGKVDEFLNFLTNIVLVIPNLPLLMVLAAFIGEASPMVIAFIIGITSWGWGARVTRAQTLSLRQRDYIQASELIGESSWRIILVELMPNLLSIIGFNFIGSVIYTVITEATLEFLGLGDPSAVSWGVMLYHAQTSSAISVGAWWEILAPCAALALFGAGLSQLNFAIDEIANPRLRTLGRLKRYQKRLAGDPEDKPPVNAAAMAAATRNDTVLQKEGSK
ncbi:ABC transporter permease [Aestuariispira insulae]|uniref:Peptide/nickel transport system permease protein n=1 Tax=Aestuariispira insulae TaxID=1461337 RepID=A0A3D9HW88_9PROT|nr:ABC transporter permease [Aestuariispira insulae]RED53758.1 peptide/nickel transport system permease protein [Aestuariispira insulae]